MKCTYYIFFILFAVTLLTACGDDKELPIIECPEPGPGGGNPDQTYLYPIDLKVLGGDGEVTLTWHYINYIHAEKAPASYTRTTILGTETPEYCEVYMATGDCGTPSLIARIEEEAWLDITPSEWPLRTYAYKVENLQNNASHSFFMVGYKKGCNPMTSPTVMIYPGARSERELFFKDAEDSIKPFRGVRISPQQDMLVFIDKGTECGLYWSNLYIADIEGNLIGEAIINVDFPAWSPDGRKIAFVSYHHLPDGNPSISVYDLDTHEITCLTEGETVDAAPVFTPSGDKIIYESIDNSVQYLRMVDLASGEVSDLFNPIGDKLWSPSLPGFDAQGMLYFMNTFTGYEKYFCKLDINNPGSQPELLIQLPKESSTFGISPDGRHLVCTNIWTGDPQLWLYELSNPQPRLLTGFELSESVYPGGAVFGWLDNNTLYYPLNERFLMKTTIE